MLRKLDPTRTGGPVVWLPGTFGDAVLAVDARLVGDAENRYVQVFVRDQGATDSPAGAYIFSVAPATARYRLARTEGARTTVLATGTSPAIKGGNEVNRLELSAAGATVSAGMNGAPVALARDATLSEGRMGIMVGTSAEALTAEARFDNLVVSVAAEPPPAPVPATVWTRQFGTAADDSATATALDPAGNAFVAGGTEAALPGQALTGLEDAFVRKYDPNGAELWTRQFGTAGVDSISDVAVDRVGNAYVAGVVGGALAGQTAAGAAGDLDAFVRKYDPNGAELWTRQFGTAGVDGAQTLAVDGAGNAYVAGLTLAALPGQAIAGRIDAFVRKYDPNGAELWTRQFGTAREDAILGIAVDLGGVAYVAGVAGAALPGQTSAADDEADAFVRKYDPNGAELWTRQFGTADIDFAYDVTIDGSGQVYVVGATSGTLPGQTSYGFIDAFVRKYDPNGAELWTRQTGSQGPDEFHAVAVDGAGNAHVVGDAFGAMPGQPAIGGADAFVARYDAGRHRLDVPVRHRRK